LCVLNTIELIGYETLRRIPVRQGLRFLRQQLSEILAKRTDVLSPRMIRIVADLSGDWRRASAPLTYVAAHTRLLATKVE
jgi:transposase